MSKLSDENIAEIYRLKAKGVKQIEIARRMSVSQATITLTLNPKAAERNRKLGRERRANRTPEQREADRERDRKRRANWTPEQREAEREQQRERNRKRRENLTPEQREAEREQQRERRVNRTPEQREADREQDRERKRRNKRTFDPKTIDLSAVFREGAGHTVKLTVRERDPRARALCFAAHGEKCAGCGVERVPWLQCHHLTPISGGERLTSADDLRPLCPSCHSAVHFFAGGPSKMLSIEELRDLLAMIESGEHLP